MIDNARQTYELIVRSDSYPEENEPSANPKRKRDGSSGSPKPIPKRNPYDEPDEIDDYPKWDFDSADPDVF